MAGSSRRILLVIVFFLTTCGFLGVLFAQKNPAVAPSSDGDVRDNVKTFTEVYSIVEENYAEPVGRRIKPSTMAPFRACCTCSTPLQLLRSQGLLAAQRRPARQVLRRRHAGRTPHRTTHRVIVIAPFVGTPAYRVGIHPGDVIAAVDGKPTDNMSTSDVADLLKGPKGTTVHITVLREGSEKPIEFTVIRDEIPRYSVGLALPGSARRRLHARLADSTKPPIMKCRRPSTKWAT